DRQTDKRQQSFEQQQEDRAAIEHRNRQEVENTEVQTEESEHSKNAIPTKLLDGSLRGLVDADWTRNCISQRALAAEYLSESLAGQAEDLKILVVCIHRGRTDSSGMQRVLFGNDKAEATVHTTFVSIDLRRLTISFDRDRDFLRIVTANVFRHLGGTLNILT